MAADPGQRRIGHRSGPQKSYRGGGPSVGRRSMENQNRPAPSGRARLNQLTISSRRTERRTRLNKTTLERGRCPASNLLKNTLRERRIRLGAPKFLFQKDRIDQMVPRLRGRIGVRAAGSKPTSKKEEEALQSTPSTSTTKHYDLTTHLHPRPPSLTSYIGVRRQQRAFARESVRYLRKLATRQSGRRESQPAKLLACSMRSLVA